MSGITTNWVAFFAKDDRFVALVNLAGFVALLVILWGGVRVLWGIGLNVSRYGWSTGKILLDNRAKICCNDVAYFMAFAFQRISRVIGLVAVGLILFEGTATFRSIPVISAVRAAFMGGATGLVLMDSGSLWLVCIRVRKLKTL